MKNEWYFDSERHVTNPPRSTLVRRVDPESDAWVERLIELCEYLAQDDSNFFTIGLIKNHLKERGEK